jgi:hypothetical protein
LRSRMIRRLCVHSRMKYGPALTTGAEMPSGFAGSEGGIAMKNGIASLARKSGARRVRLILSVYRSGTRTPLARAVLPFTTSCAPTTSSRNG